MNLNDDKLIQHREPDAGILEHERKREVEVKCAELRVQLEDLEIGEEELERQVGALRTKLLGMMRPLQRGKGTVKA